MTVFSNSWVRTTEAEILRKLRNAPRPKGSPAKVAKIKHADVFPKRKPGEGGFEMGKKGISKTDKEAETSES